MQVNKVDNNTNFKMALKINSNLRPKIIQKGNDFCLALNEYGKKISDVKLYNVVFDENLNMPKILHCKQNLTRDYFKELKAEEENLGKYYHIPSGMAGEYVGGFFPDEPRVFLKLYGKKAKAKYAAFKKLDTYHQAAEYSRMLEELDIKRIIAKEKEKSEKLIKDAQENTRQKVFERTVDSLIERYKYEHPVQSIETTKNTKKSWWQKIFE